MLFSERHACVECGISIPEMTPRMFSFNNPYGACPDCSGLGTRMYFDPEQVVPNRQLSLRDGAIAPWSTRTGYYYLQILEALADFYEFDIRTPLPSCRSASSRFCCMAPARSRSSSSTTRRISGTSTTSPLKG